MAKLSLDNYTYNKYSMNENIDDFIYPTGSDHIWDDTDKENFVKNNLYKHNDKQEYEVGDVVIYLGNTRNKTNQEGRVEKLREDGKIIVRFDDDILIAIRKEHLVIKPNDDARKTLYDKFEEFIIKMKEIEKKRWEEVTRQRKENQRSQNEREEAERKRREEEEYRYKEAEKKRLEELKKIHGTEKWWERNKKSGF